MCIPYCAWESVWNKRPLSRMSLLRSTRSAANLFGICCDEFVTAA